MKTKLDMQKDLNVSLATINNWIYTGVISKPTNGNNFTLSEYNKSIETINNSLRLNNRANRSAQNKSIVSFLNITDTETRKLLIKAISIHEQYNLSVEQSVCILSFQLLSQNNYLCTLNNVKKFISNWINKLDITADNLYLYEYLNNTIISSELDFIGAFYQSIQSISNKSKFGAFFTPKEALQDIKIHITQTVLEPCCGTGSLLLSILQKNHNPKLIHARDIDEIAINICKVNLVMFLNDVEMLSNVEKVDILEPIEYYVKDLYDVVITNPPWGSKLELTKIKNLIKNYPNLKTKETFSIALYNSILQTNKQGTTIFILPYSILNVATHINIRKYLVSLSKKISITLLGQIFENVMSEAILLSIDNSQHSKHITIKDKNNTHNLEYTTIISNNYTISAKNNQNYQEIITMIYSKKHTTLRNEQTIFGMGIVTGNNKKHIQKEKENTHVAIYKGIDIQPFKFSKPTNFINYQPNLYQQISNIDHNQHKVVYKFISKKIICAIDKENRLLLNSANFFISLNYSMKVIVSLLNSELYSFIYTILFNSNKVLKSHLEILPLPILTVEETEKIIDLHDKISYSNKPIIYLEKLNTLVYQIFNLSFQQIKLIQKEILNHGKSR